MSDSLKYQLALFHAPGFGNRAFHQLLAILKFYQLTLFDIFEKPALINDISHKLENSPEDFSIQGLTQGRNQLNTKKFINTDYY